MTAAFELEAVRRLPLAEATFRLFDFALDDKFLEDVFNRHHGRSYQHIITFPSFVHLVADALLGHRGSAHQSFLNAQAEDALEATVQAMYGKLRRVPIGLSTEFFAETAQRLRSVGVPVVANPLPPSLDEFWALGFDGKKLKYVLKLLKPLRGLKGNIFGGKLLAVQDMRTQQAVAVEAHADGEAADNPLVPGVVARIRKLPTSGPRLWVGDRAFCDFKLLGLLTEDADHFVVRFNTSCGFHADATQKMRTGKDADGRSFQEEWGWLGKPKNPHRIRVRKITVSRANAEPLILVTSLLDADKYPAADLLTLYRSRWGIEVMFQHVVQTFNLRHLIGATPQATVFQAMLCLLLYNTTMTIRDYVAAATDKQPKQISLKLLLDDLLRDLTAWVTVLDPDTTLELLRETRIEGPEDLRRHLQKLLAKTWKDRWRKAPTKKNRQKQAPRAYICGGHTSVDKIMRKAHCEIPFGPSRGGTPPFETKKHV